MSSESSDNLFIQTRILDKPTISGVFISTYSSSSRHTVYHIKVHSPVATWSTSKRYKEFHALHVELLKQHPMLDSTLFPPKKAFGNTSAEFVQKRQISLERYLQYLIQTLSPPPPRLLEFLDYKLYDISTVIQKLLYIVQKTADVWLKDDRVIHVTPVQLHCVTKQLTLPDSETGPNRHDLGHLYDFLYRLKRIKISPQLPPNFAIQEVLVFDLSILKSVTALLLEGFNIQNCHGVDTLRSHLQRLEIHRGISSMKEFFCRRTVSFLETVVEDPRSPEVKTSQWTSLTILDLRFNGLTEIDSSMVLLPNLEDLILSHNKISVIENLSELYNLKFLDLSHNDIESTSELHARIGNVKAINLAANKLRSLEGFQKMYSLEELNLMANIISDVAEVCHLGELQNMRKLALKDNPICQSDLYQLQVLAALKYTYAEVQVDGLKPTKEQLERLEVLRLSNPKYFGITAPSPSEVKRKIPPKSAVIDSPGDEGHGDVESTLQASVSVRERIDQMRKEGGDRWLSMLTTCKVSPLSSKESTPKSSPKITPRSSPKMMPKRKAAQNLMKLPIHTNACKEYSSTTKKLFSVPENTLAFIPTLQPTAESRPDANGEIIKSFFAHQRAQSPNTDTETLQLAVWGSVLLYNDPVHIHDCCVLVSDQKLHIYEFHICAGSNYSWMDSTALPLRPLLECPLNTFKVLSFGISNQALHVETSSSRVTFAIICRSAHALDSLLQSLRSYAPSLKDTTSDDLIALKVQLVQKPLGFSSRYSPTRSLDADCTWREKLATQCTNDMSKVEVKTVSFVLQFDARPSCSETEQILSSECHLMLLISTADTIYTCSANFIHYPNPSFSDTQISTPQFLIQSSFPISCLQGVTITSSPFMFTGYCSHYELYPVTFSFQQETDNVHKEWNLYFRSREEQECVLQDISGIYFSQTSQKLCPSEVASPAQHSLVSRSNSVFSVEQLLSEVERHPSDVVSTYFKEMFAINPKSEEFGKVMRVFVIPYSHPGRQFEALVCFSTAAVYIMSTKSVAEMWIKENVISNVSVSLEDDQMSPLLLASVPFSAVQQVNVGLFDLSLRITSDTDTSTFTFITMDEVNTEYIIGHFRNFQGSPDKSALSSVPKIEYPELDFHKLQSCVYAASANQRRPIEDTSTPALRSYLLVQSVDVETFAPVSTKTLALTNNGLYVLSENYVLWPVPTFSETLPQGDKFAVEESIRMENIVRIDVANTASCDFTVVFLVGMGSITSQLSADDEKLVGQLMDSVVLHNQVEKAQIDGSVLPPPDSFRQLTFQTKTFAQREKFLSILQDAWESAQRQELLIALKRDSV